jgi:hypothetical protein
MKNGFDINIGDYYFTLYNWHILVIVIIKKIRKQKANQFLFKR